MRRFTSAPIPIPSSGGRDRSVQHLILALAVLGLFYPLLRAAWRRMRAGKPVLMPAADPTALRK